jgi:hypothetical protein
MTLPILHVSYDFTTMPEDEVDTFAGGIITNLYGLVGAANYPAPPVTKVALIAGLKKYTDAQEAMVGGGEIETALKSEALRELIDLLRQDAGYVENEHGNVMSVLLSSGFNAASTNHAQQPLGQAMINKISHAGPGRLLVEAGVITNSHGFQGRYKPVGAADSAYVNAENLGADRKMTFIDLPRLTEITLGMRAIGGSEGYGQWSDGQNHAVT